MSIAKIAKNSGEAAWEAVRFFARFCADPRGVGAVAPSSRALAGEMARLADGFGAVIELGAGSGAITKEIAKRPHGAIWAVEIDHRLAKKLEKRFPGVRVVEGCAADVILAAGEEFGEAAIVSSLPFKSLPKAVSARIVREIEGFLLEREGRRLVQFTYAASEPFEIASKDLAWKKEAVVWTNTPPAAVWVLERRP